MHQLGYYTHAIHERAKWDAQVASKIAQSLKLNHTVLPFVPPTNDARQHWLARTGYCVGGNGSYTFQTLDQIGSGRVAILGTAGEVGRASYGEGVKKTTPIDASLLLRKLRLPKIEITQRAAEKWLAGLSSLNAQQIMDLLYIEQRLGCWAGPSLIASSHVTFAVPFNQRAIFERMLDTPYELRRKSRIHYDIIKLMNGQLMTFPHQPLVYYLKYYCKRALQRLGLRRRRKKPIRLGCATSASAPGSRGQTTAAWR
jgi:hypothetical protein